MFVLILMLEFLISLNLNISSAYANQVSSNLNTTSTTASVYFTPLVPTYEMISSLDLSDLASVRAYLKIITPPNLPYDVVTGLQINFEEFPNLKGVLGFYKRTDCPTLNLSPALINRLKNKSDGIGKSFGQILAAITIGHEYQHYLFDLSGSDVWVRSKAPKAQGLGGSDYGSSSMPNLISSEMNAFAWQTAALVSMFSGLYQSNLKLNPNFTLNERKNILQQLWLGLDIHYEVFAAMADLLNSLTVVDANELNKKATITSQGDDGKGNLTYLKFYIGSQGGPGGKYIVQNNSDGTMTVQLEANENPPTDFFLEKTVSFNGDFNDTKLVLNTAVTVMNDFRSGLHKQVKDLQSARDGFNQVQDFLLKQKNDQNLLDLNVNDFFKNFKIPHPFSAVGGTKIVYRKESIYNIFPQCKKSEDQ
ncbi:MAG: hypothetical protein ACXVCR_16350 [Bdellovibrio sp.]